MLIYNRNRELARWAGDIVGIRDFGPCVAIGVAHEGEIVAAAIFNQWLHPNIHVTFATSSAKWQSRAAIRGILSYPFLQLRCKRVTAITEHTNEKARSFLLRLGFKQEGYHPDTFPMADGVSYGLLPAAAARFIPELRDPPHEIPSAA